jgi:hypothetical protein
MYVMMAFVNTLIDIHQPGESTMSTLIDLILFGSGFVLGVISLLSYMILRMMKSDGWDKSNITNALRVLSHVVMHPEDFGKLWYVQDGVVTHRPFWYISLDELSEVVDSRP